MTRYIFSSYFRVQKSRAYMQTLVPLLCFFGQRSEEALHESVATALSSICPALGHFASDREVKLILSAYQGNLTHSSPSIRRAAAQSLLTVCKHSRKPAIFLGCLVSLVLKMALPADIPVSTGVPAVVVTGCFFSINGCLNFIFLT